jgi:outer membrane protein, heavy metal efflux system
MRHATAFVCVLLLCCVRQTGAQTDTVHIAIQEAEQTFLRRNLQLLAARFNIDAARASVVQAGLWNNPSLSIEQNVHNQFTGKWFDFTGNGNTGLQIQQLLLLAGKRGKKVRIAEINAEMAEHDFLNVVRALKLELRTDLYDLFFLRRSLAFFDESIATISNTVNLMENVYQQRAILLAELLRVKALLFSLQNDRLALVARIASTEQSLRILLRDTSQTTHIYVPDLDLGGLDLIRPGSLTLSQVLDAAAENRPDLKKASANVQLEEANLAYQKALAIPDVTVGGLWSRAGGYIPDYYAVTLAVDLPLFDRNQGNIEVSERTIDANRAMYESQRAEVAEEVRTAYVKALRTDSLYRSFDRQFPVQYRSLVSGMVANYEKRYVNVIEFTDFIESYRTSMVQMNSLENDRADAIEELNYTAGTTIFHP